MIFKSILFRLTAFRSLRVEYAAVLGRISLSPLPLLDLTFQKSGPSSCTWYYGHMDKWAEEAGYPTGVDEERRSLCNPFFNKKNIYLHRPPLRACVCVFKFRSNNGPGSATQSNWKGCDPSGIGQWRSIYTNYRDTLKVGKVNRTCFNFYFVTKMRKLNDIQVYSF